MDYFIRFKGLEQIGVSGFYWFAPVVPASLGGILLRLFARVPRKLAKIQSAVVKTPLFPTEHGI